jgi:hypothetical protein
MYYRMRNPEPLKEQQLWATSPVMRMKHHVRTLDTSNCCFPVDSGRIALVVSSRKVHAAITGEAAILLK